jgi:hypothetical protein
MAGRTNGRPRKNRGLPGLDAMEPHEVLRQQSELEDEERFLSTQGVGAMEAAALSLECKVPVDILCRNSIRCTTRRRGPARPKRP